MMSRVRGLAAVLVAGLAMAQVGVAQVEVGASADVSALSAYVWRGQVLNDEAVVQPSATITKGGFSLNTWGNFNLTDEATGDSSEFSEVDLTAAYGRSIGPVALSAGLIEYLFPHQTLTDADGRGVAYPGTREVYCSASLPGLPVVPALTLYYDYDEADSFYGVGALSYTAKLMDALSLGLFASLGYGAADYNEFYFGVDDAALNDANVGASLAWTVAPFLTVTPACQYTMLVDSDVEDGAEGLYKDKDQTIFSLKATYTF